MGDTNQEGIVTHMCKTAGVTRAKAEEQDTVRTCKEETAQGREIREGFHESLTKEVM